MQTAIDWLIDQYVKNDSVFLAGVYEQAKEIENKQHKTTFHRGINIGALNPELDIEGRKESAKHYYETAFDKAGNQKELIVVDFDKVQKEWIEEANGMTDLEKAKYYNKKIQENENR